MFWVSSLPSYLFGSSGARMHQLLIVSYVLVYNPKFRLFCSLTGPEKQVSSFNPEFIALFVFVVVFVRLARILGFRDLNNSPQWL